MMPVIAKRLGLLPSPVIIVLTVAYAIFGIATSFIFQSVPLEVALNLLLILPVSIIVARISTKSFLATGSLNILLLGTAVLTFGMMALLGGFVSGLEVEKGIVVYVIGAFAAACLHIANAILSYLGSPKRTSKLKLIVGFHYGFICALAAIVVGVTSTSELIDSLGVSGTIGQR